MRKKKYPAYIISVDNLAFGGTGKTPLTLMLVEELLARKFPVAIVTRGYRSAYERDGLRVGPEHTAAQVGDEAALLKRRTPDSGVYIGRCRACSIERAVEDGYRFVVLDDGLQSTDIKKNFSIMLVKRSHPYYYLRNFRFYSQREDVVLYLDENETLHEPGSYRFTFTGFFDSNGNQVEVGASGIAGFSALGDNARFKKDLEQYHCLGFKGFPDHHAYDARDLKALDDFRRNLNAEYLVCTEKDFVKIQPNSIGEIPLIFVKNSIKLSVDLMGQILDDAKAKGFV